MMYICTVLTIILFLDMNYKRIFVIALIAILAIGLAVVSYFLIEKQQENKEYCSLIDKIQMTYHRELS